MLSKINLEIIYQVICSNFTVIVVLANILSAKMVPLPLIPLSVPAGLIVYPLTFLLTDLVTEVYGMKKAQYMIYVALATNLLGFGIIQISLMLPGNETQEAFQMILGLTGLRIFSSLISFVTAQIADVYLYAWIKEWTGSKWLWLRNNGSTCISQMIDTAMIDIIFLWWGLGMPVESVLPIMIFSYLYKACFSVLCTPLFYFLVYIIRLKWPIEKRIVNI